MPKNRFSAARLQQDLEKIVAMIATISVKLSFLITLTGDEWSGTPPQAKRSRSRPCISPVLARSMKWGKTSSASKRPARPASA